jgi:hypothetical protein
MTVLNGYKMIREHGPGEVAGGRFDPHSLVVLEKHKIQTPEGEKEIQMREKGFTPNELHHMFVRADLEILELWGGTAGNWNKKQLDLDEYEIMILGRKPS